MSELVEKKIFQAPKEPETREEEKKELTPGQKYILEQTNAGRVLRLLEKDPRISQLYEKRPLKDRQMGRALEILRDLEIIKIENGLAKEIHPENLEILWEGTRAKKIFELVDEKEFITVSQIAEILNLKTGLVYKHVKKLERVGLVKSAPWRGQKILFSPSFWEQKIGEREKLEPKKIVRREMLALREALEIIKKTGEEIKRTKETKEQK